MYKKSLYKYIEFYIHKNFFLVINGIQTKYNLLVHSYINNAHIYLNKYMLLCEIINNLIYLHHHLSPSLSLSSFIIISIIQHHHNPSLSIIIIHHHPHLLALSIIINYHHPSPSSSIIIHHHQSSSSIIIIHHLHFP